MNNRLVISSTIGYMCLGLTLWMLNLGDTHWVAGPNMQAMFMAFSMGAVVLGVIAILSFFHGRTLDAVIFFGSAAAFLVTSHHGAMGPQADSAGTSGWFWLVWAIFFFYVWLGSFKAGWARSLFLLVAWLSLLAYCLFFWLGWGGFDVISGYLGLLDGLIATYISAATIINHGCGKTCLPGNPGDAS